MNAFATLTLATARLDLRPMVPADAPALFAICSDEAVMRHGASPPWTDLQLAVDRIERDRRWAEDGTALKLGLYRRSDGALIGDCMFFLIDAQCRRAEVGYQLASWAWGQGYATEALSALLAHGFRVLGFNRVEADVDPRNLASVRLLERLGFVREGLLRERWIVGGEKSDSAMYGLLAAEFESGAGR